jgi:hypothetical protein
MIHIDDWRAGLDWYQRAFPEAVCVTEPDHGFVSLVYREVSIEIVPADGKMASGAAGSVVYWGVDDFDASLAYFFIAWRAVISWSAGD